MTNEELALLIKQGQKEHYGELWENTKRLFFRYANRFYCGNAERCTSAGVEYDDVIQSCFLVLVDVVRAYEPEKGYKLSTYIRYHFKNRMKALINGEIEGGRSAAYKNLLNCCESFNEPIKFQKSDSDELMLIDTIEDETAAEPFKEVERSGRNKYLRAELERIIDKSLSPKQAELIRRRFFKGQRNKDLTRSELVLLTSIKHKLARNEEIKALYKENYFDYYTGTGVTAFRNKQCSSVEFAAEKAEEKRRALMEYYYQKYFSDNSAG